MMIRTGKVILFSFAALLSNFSTLSAQQLTITYEGNMGVMITIGQKKFLMDAIHTGIPGKSFVKPAAPSLDKMITNKTPYENVDALFISHVHSDHFNSNLTVKMILSNLTAMAFMPEQAFDSMRQAMQGRRLNIRNIPTDTKDFVFKTHEYSVKAFSVEHVYQRWWAPDIHNVIYLLQCGGYTILHTGDADLDEEVLRSLQLLKYKIDVAIIPYWIINESKDDIKKWINPKKIIAAHITASGDFEIQHQTDRDVIVFDKLSERFEMQR